MLTVAGIAHRMKQKEDRNAMGKIDSTIRHVKALLFKGVAEDTQRDWVARLPGVVETYNKRLGHEGSYGSTPQEVLTDDVLNFQVRQKMARGLEHNDEMHKKYLKRAQSEPGFRHVLKTDKWPDDLRARYSSQVHRRVGTDGPYVTDETGALYNPKLIRPAPPGSQNVEVPRVVVENRRGRMNWKREAIYEWAKRIHQYILNRPDQKVSQMNNPFTRHFKQQDAFFEAMKAAQMATKRDTQRYSPNAVATLFGPIYFRIRNKVITAVGVMPPVFDPSAMEEDPEGEADEEAAAPAAPAAPAAAPAAPVRRLVGKQPLIVPVRPRRRLVGKQ